VEAGINEFLNSHAADMLAMVAHRHNIFYRLFGTEHTKEMTYNVQLPLLILEDR
jgi:hypothetical protein